MEAKAVDQTIDALKITNDNNQDDLNKLRLVANDTLLVHSESLICIMILKQISNRSPPPYRKPGFLSSKVGVSTIVVRPHQVTSSKGVFF